MKLSLTTLVTAALVGAVVDAKAKAADCQTVVSRATDSTDVLIGLYNKTNGMWGPTDGDELNGGSWWTTASMIHTIVDLINYVPERKGQVLEMAANTFYGAQKYNLGFQNNSEGLKELEQKPTPLVHGSFYNDYYDDEGWWAIAWSKVYDQTKDERYLKATADIFEDMTTGWDTQSCGGELWGKGKGYVSAISNELFLYTAASLANRATGDDKDKYLDWLNKSWTWFKNSKLRNSNNTINDGLLENCDNNNDVTWSYNQGVILGGLVEGHKVTGDQSMLDYANEVAKGAIKTLSDSNGILHDSCEPKCGDGSLNNQFKGIFIRNLSYLQSVSPDDEFKNFILNNADSIWANARDASDGMIGEVWSGPVVHPTVNSLSSALDCLIEAIPQAGCSK